MIPLEAIEAAAHRLALEAWGGWEFVPNTIRTQFLRDAYLALEAAAPYLMTQAFDEGADFMSAGCWTETGAPGNPYLAHRQRSH